MRPGVGRAREELAALVGLDVAEVSGPGRSKRADPLPRARVLIGTEAVLHRARSVSVVVFLDFDHEVLAPRFRGAEQALALLGLASRLVGGRRRSGRVVVRTRLPDHDVLAAAVHGDPSLLVAAERPQRELLRLPPYAALATVSGEGAESMVERLRALPLDADGQPLVEAATAADGDRRLVRARSSDVLAEALAAAGAPGPGTRVEVDPRDV